MHGPATPKRLGSWTLDRSLGHGGFGSVFAAHHDSSPGVTRALKWVPNAAPGVVQRAQREAEVLARLSHPGIVRIHDVGAVEGGLYLVLDLVEGEPLRAVIARHQGGLPLAEACHLASAVARAVGAAHRAGVVHRDLKPENVLRTPEGELRVLDFGLALDRQAERLTRTGTSLGTLGYMAPEQLDGRRELQGPASDVYSLGAIFYELVTGRPVVPDGTPLERLAAAASGELVLPSHVRPELPSEADALVIRALAQEPRHRFPDGETFAAALATLLRHEAEGTREAVTVRGRLRGLAAAALAVALVAGAVLAFRALHLSPETVAVLRRRVDAELGHAPPDAARVAAILEARDAFRFRPFRSDDVEKAADDLDLALAHVRLRADLYSRDEAAALAAARELALRALVGPGDRARVGETLFREKDPTKLRTALDLLHKDAKSREARETLAQVLVPYAAGERPERRKLLLASHGKEFGDSYARAAARVAEGVAADLDGESRDGAIDLLEALRESCPPGAAAELRAIGGPEAKLRLARAGARRGSDPAGVLADRAKAFEAAPAEPSPPWYAGYLSRRALALVDALDMDRVAAGERVADELLAVLLEAFVEDAAWAWPTRQLMAMLHVARSREQDRDASLVRAGLMLMLQDGPYGSTLDERGSAAAGWASYPPRTGRLALSLALRQTGAGRPVGSLAGAPPASPEEPALLTATILRAHRTQETRLDETERARLEAAIEAAKAPVESLRRAHESAPGEPDLERSWLLARARLANLYLFLAQEAATALDARVGPAGSPWPPGLEPEIARVRGIFEQGIAVCPQTYEYARLYLFEKEMDHLNYLRDARGVLDVWASAARDPVYAEIVEDPSRDPRTVDMAIQIVHLGSMAALATRPARRAQGEQGLALLRRLVPRGNPDQADKYEVMDRSLQQALDTSEGR